MALRIEDYAVIGDTQTAALVGIDGSIDWLCLPRFDSGACFASLLGTEDNGRWLLSPKGGLHGVDRRYRDDSLILETTFETEDGVVRVVDFMPPRGNAPDVVRLVQGVRGRVPMRMELIVRFDYGWIVPWLRRTSNGLLAVAGPDTLWLRTPVDTRGENMTTQAEFVVAEGEQVPFVLTWVRSQEDAPEPVDADRALRDTESFWAEWAQTCRYTGDWRDAVQRSLVTLKALTYEPTGGIVAAVTTSLPEQLGGVRNWDYRYCWLRDSTLTLLTLLNTGYTGEARAWRDWLLRAVAGSTERPQIMYGLSGERRLPEIELDWLTGYEQSKPVRVGNAAQKQFQLDVFGEVVESLYTSRRQGIEADTHSWDLQLALLDFLESHWDEPDEGIWEVRGDQCHFVHSKVMAWVAFDRAVRSVESFGLDGPIEKWKSIRDEIFTEVCAKGYDADRRTFTQSYGSNVLDASVLMIPLVGFLPPDDERVRTTIEAIEKNLMVGGLVSRYDTAAAGNVDGLPPGEGQFLACSFWLAQALAMTGRTHDARALFEHLLSLRNDVGLLAEEYDVNAGRQVGNFPQAFSHLALVNTAWILQGDGRTPGMMHRWE